MKKGEPEGYRQLGEEKIIFHLLAFGSNYNEIHTLPVLQGGEAYQGKT